MKFNTRFHGVIEYKKEDIIYFEKGIPGFENLNKYIVIPIEENEMFSLLHSIEDGNIGIVVTSPFSFKKDYEVKLSQEVINRLKIEKEEDVLILNTITLDSKVENITTNLKAPIVINIKEKLGEQLILDKSDYKVKFPLFKEEKQC